MSYEVKQLRFQSVKADETDGKMRFEGYLAVFDNVDSYGDVIIRGAFSETINEAKKDSMFFPILEQHGWGKEGYIPIGYFEDIFEDDTGLYVKGVLVDTKRGVDIYKLLKGTPKGFMGMSIGFSCKKHETVNDGKPDNKGCIRKLLSIKLYEGSIVTFPANDKARVTEVKEFPAFDPREVERHLKENGYSNNEAKKIAGAMKNFNVKIENKENDENNLLANKEDEKNFLVKKEDEDILEKINSFKQILVAQRINNFALSLKLDSRKANM